MPRLLPWIPAGDPGPTGSTHWVRSAGKASCSQRSLAGAMVTKCQGAQAVFSAMCSTKHRACCFLLNNCTHLRGNFAHLPERGGDSGKTTAVG